MKKIDNHVLVDLIEKKYPIKVDCIEDNPSNGFLGDTFVINRKFILKLPKRGGVPFNPQGNVKFSTYIMEEANLHGIPSPLNVRTKSGSLFAYDSRLGYFHLMEKLDLGTISISSIPREKLTFLLGFHASQITSLTSNIKKYFSFKKIDYLDHWSMKASAKKLFAIFGLNEEMDTNEVLQKLTIGANNLNNHEQVPKTLVEQIDNLEPLKIINLAKEYMSHKQIVHRNFVVHNDIKPENIAFGINPKTNKHEITGSFDYTMSCLGNPAKNIAYTVVDSFIGVSKDSEIDYKEILRVAKGALCGFRLNKNEILSVETEILSACLKKYALRWEYWKKEIEGETRDFNVAFLNPKEMYNLFLTFYEVFSDNPINEHILKLSKEYSPEKIGLNRVDDFLLSDDYQKLRLTSSQRIKETLKQYYEDALESCF